MESPLEVVGWAKKLGEVGPQRNHQGWVNGFSQVDGYSDLVPTCMCMLDEGRAQQRNMVSASTSFLRKAAPPAITLKPDNLVTFCTSLVFLKLLAQC